MSVAFLSDLLQTIVERGRAAVGLSSSAPGYAHGRTDFRAMCDTLLSSAGEASGVALARAILTEWHLLDRNGRCRFLMMLAEHFGPDRESLDGAIRAYQQHPGAKELAQMHAATEPRRQELIRRLNLAPRAIETLVRMREELLVHREANPELDAVDADFLHLFTSWFNRGFLVLRRIDWATPANILEKIIRHEAVHAIHDWNDLRRRIEPPDRRCFAFFHPQLVDEPLIFVEVALTHEIPAAIATLLAESRAPIAASEATAAVFYSISNCQIGLRGISFGNFLIKQVLEDLRRELPNLSTFATLSPAPGFAAWLARERRVEKSQALSTSDKGALHRLDRKGWQDDPAAREALLTAAAYYLAKAKKASGRPIDPVARFHLGNGARLERLDFLGDVSDKGLHEAHGLMVNYLYKLDDIERNHEAFIGKGEVATAAAVRRMLRSGPSAAKSVTDDHTGKLPIQVARQDVGGVVQ